MNLEIATRLVGLRKANKLSQEALAEKLGISRQAVSKWERAEASPDTDNLIALAKLYHISLDELLKINEEDDSDIGDCDGEEPADACLSGTAQAGMQMMTLVTEPETEKDMTGQAEDETQGKDPNSGYGSGSDDEDDVHIGLKGIHVKDRNGDEVHIGWDGIHVHDKNNEVHIDKNGIYVNGEEARRHIFVYEKEKEAFPLGILAIVIYILIGILFNMWHPGWILFLLVPVISSLIGAVRSRNANLFAYPILVTFLFLYAGLVHFLWHPAWALFLTIPIYYSLVGFIRDRSAKEEEES